MDEEDFEGTLILEKLAEIKKVEEFFDAIDAEDIKKVRKLMKLVRIDENNINLVLEKIQNGDD